MSNRGICWARLLEPIEGKLYEKGNPHHITLFYDVEFEEYEHLIGIEFEAHIIAECYNSAIQALLVELPDDNQILI